ncbi:glutathione binding-like protein [Xanthomonadaceae bacterium JHOS43]|nr:glutathione binding-like protein [Xanthomonadaceae bacterium JHOS43]MCX7563144.1 glutathione binding-like protein [Xanthomonadaceae bacterium XH05]
MKLYSLPGACSLADHIVLEWIGQPYEVAIVARDELKTSYLKVNPSGAVPALQLDDGSILTQNIAILDYLAGLAPNAALTGDGSATSRARVMRWLAFLNADVHKNFSPLFSASRFVAGEEAQADLKQKAIARLREQFESLDAQLGEGTWLVDNQRSLADPYLYVILRWARAMQLDLSGLDNLARFFEHMAADAGVRVALKAEGLS